MRNALFAALTLVSLMGCAESPLTVSASAPGSFSPTATSYKAKGAKRETAYFAGGCFWGLEYRFREVPGVTATAVGYSGGHTKNPTYEDVCSHTTGHAETTMVEYDPESVSYQKLVKLFFTEFHNPTTVDRQGPDVGDSYRSVLFYQNPEQKKIAEEVRAEVQKGLTEPVVTQFVSFQKFWPAEAYHQNYCVRTGHLVCPIEPPKRKDGGDPSKS